MVTSIDGKPVLEVGMVGREGMCGAEVALRVLTQPLHALVQGPGTAWRVTTSAFRQELDQCAPLQLVMDRYLYVLMTQLASAAATLQHKGLIEYSRGRVTVLDRKSLQLIACSCYADDKRAYARIMH